MRPTAACCRAVVCAVLFTVPVDRLLLKRAVPSGTALKEKR